MDGHTGAQVVTTIGGEVGLAVDDQRIIPPRGAMEPDPGVSVPGFERIVIETRGDPHREIDLPRTPSITRSSCRYGRCFPPRRMVKQSMRRASPAAVRNVVSRTSVSPR